MERLSERLTALEAIIRKLEPVEELSGTGGIAGKEHLRDQKGLYFFGSMHVHRGIRKYAV